MSESEIEKLERKIAALRRFIDVEIVKHKADKAAMHFQIMLSVNNEFGLQIEELDRMLEYVLAGERKLEGFKILFDVFRRHYLDVMERALDYER